MKEEVKLEKLEGKDFIIVGIFGLLFAITQVIAGFTAAITAIAFLFFMHYRETKALSSLLIGVHFLGYVLLLFIWPLEDFKLAFYAGRTIITTIMAIGFIDLIRRT